MIRRLFMFLDEERGTITAVIFLSLAVFGALSLWAEWFTG